MRIDFCVVGGGIVGLATAHHLLAARPDASLLLLEKEAEVGRHQTGHNSGVIHSGIYYEPGSLKAELCRRGARSTEEFAARHGIGFDVPGKLIVATDAGEHARMLALHARSQVNGVPCRLLGAEELREREPHVSGTGALLVEQTGVIDYGAVARALAGEVRGAGGQVVTGATVRAIEERDREVHVGVDTAAGRTTYAVSRLIVCAGLQADRLALLAGLSLDLRIVPFRGEYFEVDPARRDLVSQLIYPVPDPQLPFLGIHVTPTYDGRLTVGPNAVLGLAREGYRRGAVDLHDAADIARFPGTWRLARRHVAVGARELANSLSRRQYLRACRRYLPALELGDLRPFPAGIRAQAVRRDGTLVHDFAFARSARSVHVLNAPSPAATSALPIGEHLAGLVLAE